MNLINLFKKREQTEMITEETLPDVQQIKVPDLKQYLLNGYKEIREVKQENEKLQLKLEEESKYKGGGITLLVDADGKPLLYEGE